MKRFAVLFFVLSLFVLYGQGPVGFYAGLGYGGIFPSSAGVDTYISEYNSQRSAILTKNLEAPSMLKGLSFYTGMFASNILVELGIFNTYGTMTSEADPAKITPGTISKREIELGYSSFYMALGWVMGKDILRFGPYLELPIASLKFETTTPYGKKSDDKIDNYFGLSPGVVVIIGDPTATGAFGTIRATYTFGLGNPDWGSLYYATQTKIDGVLVPTGAKGAFGGFGIRATLSATIGCL